MTEKQLIENILNVVRHEMTEDERTGFLYNAMNDVNAWNGAFEESFPHAMYAFDDYFCDMEPTEIVQATSTGKFCIGDDYFIMDLYGLESIPEEELIEKLDYLDEEIIENFVDVLNMIEWQDFTTGKIKTLIESFLESEGA